MKKLSILLISLLPSLASLAQKEAPAYGKIDKADLQMTTCDFDPEADAYVLVRTGQTTYNLNGGEIALETVHRVRVKILKDKGVSRGNVRIVYWGADRAQEIDEISGETYNLDASGNIVKSKLDHAAIFTKQIDKDLTETTFTLPDVRKGSVIEYRYTKISKWVGNIDPWYFQDDIPTRYSQFYLAIPQYYDFSYRVTRTLPVEQKDETQNEAARSWTMHNIPGLRDEPYSSAPRDFLQHIDFQIAGYQYPGEVYKSLRTNWGALTKELLDNDDFGSQLHKSIPHTEALDHQLDTLKDSVARMSAVYDYVREHMSWNGWTGVEAAQGVKTAWEKKSGSVTEINMILIDLLKDAGIQTWPMLVSTRDHGRINRHDPLLAQFNETVAYVEIGDNFYLLNAADKYNPYRLVPYDVNYTLGYIVDRNDTSFVPLVKKDNIYKALSIQSNELTEDGLLKGSAQVVNYDYSKNPRCEKLKEGMDKYTDAYLRKGYTNLKVDSVSIEGADDDTKPLVQNVEFTQRLNGSGPYLFFSPNLFLGLEKNPFVAEQRFTDVDFGYKQSYMFTGNLHLPDGYKCESLPKNIRMIIQDTSIVLIRQMQVDDNMINFQISVEFKRPFYTQDEYGDFREFYKRLYDALNEPIVIRKKNQ